MTTPDERIVELKQIMKKYRIPDKLDEEKGYDLGDQNDRTLFNVYVHNNVSPFLDVKAACGVDRTL